MPKTKKLLEKLLVQKPKQNAVQQNEAAIIAKMF